MTVPHDSRVPRSLRMNTVSTNFCGTDHKALGCTVDKAQCKHQSHTLHHRVADALYSSIKIYQRKITLCIATEKSTFLPFFCCLGGLPQMLNMQLVGGGVCDNIYAALRLRGSQRPLR